MRWVKQLDLAGGVNRIAFSGKNFVTARTAKRGSFLRYHNWNLEENLEGRWMWHAVEVNRELAFPSPSCTRRRPVWRPSLLLLWQRGLREWL